MKSDKGPWLAQGPDFGHVCTRCLGMSSQGEQQEPTKARVVTWIIINPALIPELSKDLIPLFQSEDHPVAGIAIGYGLPRVHGGLHLFIFYQTDRHPGAVMTVRIKSEVVDAFQRGGEDPWRKKERVLVPYLPHKWVKQPNRYVEKQRKT